MRAEQGLNHLREIASEPLSPESDARLIEEIRSGHLAAFESLVRRYEKSLVRVLMRFVNDPDTAEDLAQETFLRVYTRLNQFDPARRFSPWLFRIGVNLAMDYHRSRKTKIWKRLFLDRRNHYPHEPVSPDPTPTHEIQREVRRIVDKIPERYRTVLILRDMENFSTSEIAAILNRKEPTIRWRLAEARNRFQELWEISNNTNP